MTALLTMSKLACGYAGSRVLNEVSMTVDAGEIVALIGRNGVGKTTLMRALTGLIPLSAGSITLAGVEMGKARPFARALQGVGYVPQGREVFASLSVRENLHVGAQANRARFAEMLERVIGFFPIVGKRLQQKAGTLSGGEQQQLAIARALMGGPKVLLLDEPSEGIQPSIVTLIGETLLDIARETKIGVLLVEQNVGMVERVATRCCVMEKGRILDTLNAEQIADESLIRRYLAL